jgi:hypothetical protein
MLAILLVLMTTAAPQRAFAELREMCALDGGRMWGVDLCGPTLIVDPKTRAVEANRPAPATVLPNNIGIANTAVEWDGVRWAMIMGPLPADDFARRALLAHESFHRVQGEIGFPSTSPSNAHLDRVEGRYWLQLEWRALAKALAGDRQALRDALAFRAKRRALFANAASEERRLEMHEGLAEYAGVAFAEPDVAARMPHLVAKLRDAEKTPTFVRSFAYATGAAWGTLIEQKSPGWTRKARASDDLADLARAAWRVSASHRVASRADRYGGAALLASERERDAKKQAILRDFRARFVDAPHLTLPLRKMNMQFNPDQAQPFEPHGTVYPTITLADDWGKLEVRRGGVLIASDWKSAAVPLPAGDDYTLSLKDGWAIVGNRVQRASP